MSVPRSGSQGARKRAPKKNAAKPYTTVTAHAGSLGTRANTLESFKAALAFHVDYLETDVRFTPQNEAYLSHDSIPLPLQRNAMRLKDLLKLVASHPKVRLNLDMKEYGGVKEMARLVKRAGMASRVILTGIGRDAVSSVRGRVEGLPYLLNAHPNLWHRATAAGAAALVRTIKACGALGLNAHFLFVTRRLAHALTAAGLSVSVWTVDGEPEMRRMLHLPADNITTNRIDTLLTMRNGRSR
jgi:glycerophosphoryl diester phosphodiesterase